MGTLGRTTRNGKKIAARRVELRERPHPAIAKLAVALREYNEAVEQQAATADILHALSRSSSDPQPVFEAIVEHAHRLCGAVFSILYRYDGNVMTIAADRMNAKASRILRSLYPAPPRRDHIVGRAMLEGRMMHSADIQNDPRFRANRNAFMKAMPCRAGFNVPLLQNGAVVGSIAVGRLEAKAFTKKEIGLLKTFADQAVIAIENVRLFNETKEALEHQKASADILRIVAGSVENTDPVFEAITSAAMRLVPDIRVALFLARDRWLHYVSHSGISEQRRAELAKIFPIELDRNTANGMAIVDKRIVHIPDVNAAPKDMERALELSRSSGYRAILCVPLTREGVALGSLSMTRVAAGPFSEKQIALARTFADQAVIAIQNAQMFREIQDRNAQLKQSLDFQGASGEILASISSSIADTQPVFDAIVRNVVRLFGTKYAAVFMLHGEQLALAALEGDPFSDGKFAESFPQPVDHQTLTGKVLDSGKVMQLAPIIGNPEASEQAVELARRSDYNAMIIAPMIRGDKVIGAIGTARSEPIGFDEKQVALLKAFADQAVIAIENARLFNETKESLDRQTATAEILRVISSTPTDTQPVFEAIVQSAQRLMAGKSVALVLRRESEFFVAAYSAPGLEDMPAEVRTVPLDRTKNFPSRVMLDGEVLHIPDWEAEDVPEHEKVVAKAFGFGSGLQVPLLREGQGIGALVVSRQTKGQFHEKEIALLRSFADQAVIAIENVRLFNETKESLERQTATAEILKVISSSTTDTQPVLDAITETAHRLFAVSEAGVALLRNGRIELAATRGLHPARVQAMRSSFPRPLGLDSVANQVVERGMLVHLPDTESPEVPEITRRNNAAMGVRAVLGVPMLRDGEPAGGIFLSRLEPGAFSGKQIALLQTFAAQAVIAIENARLFNETKEALERQTATSEILRVIAGTPTDTQPVFDAIVQSAQRLMSGKSAILLLRRETEFFVAAYSIPGLESLPAEVRTAPLDRDKNFPSQVMLDRKIVHVPDWEADDVIEFERFVAKAYGIGSGLQVPLVRKGEGIGSLAVTRETKGPFSEKEIALLQSFADQAVIAIENVRLFDELQTRNRALSEALEQQTATGEILKVISSSTSDVQPVFDTIIRNAVRLCDGAYGGLFRCEGDMVDLVADYNFTPEARAEYRRDFPQPLDANNPMSRAILERTVINMADVLEASYSDEVKRRVTALGGRAGLAVPMMRGDTPIGAIAVVRREPGAFGEAYVALLKTFADQAVIALENVRLFNEITEALRLQTSTADVLKTISRSTFDLDAVLQALLDNATRLSGAERAMMLRPDAAGNYLPTVTFGFEADSPLLARVRERPIRPGRESINGRVLLEKKPIHVPDVLADPEYGRQDLVELGSYRTVLSVPMLRDGEAIGLISLNKGPEVDPFTDKQMELVTTFADQAVIAIENVRLFREIEEKSAQLEVANKHKSDFLANMSHELRTPLNAIIGFSEALMERMFGELNNKQADYLKDIHESGKHLLSLINDILDLSKIEAGRMDLEISSFHLPTALSNAMTLVRERAQRHGIELGLEVDPELGELCADERKFKQIVLNLLSNAVKFTPDGGRVDVSARKFDAQIEVAVRDTGIGIAAADQAAVFEEFKQVGGDPLRKAEGTGLGLALTKRFVELHGGAIRLESAPGKGSTFAFTLPVRQ